MYRSGLVGAPGQGYRRRVGRDLGGSVRRSGLALTLVLVAASVAVTEWLRPPLAVAGATFTVVSVGDESDIAPGDGLCDVDPGVASPCTLRAAIEEANALAGHDVIEFAIPGPGPHRIQAVTGVDTNGIGGPDSAYDQFTDPAGLTIDGYSQPGSSANTLANGSNAILMIELRGLGPESIDGFDIRSSHNVIRGIAMFDFQRHVRIFGADADFNEITGSFLGTDAAAFFGQASRFRNANAVHIERGAQENRVGGPGAANRNVIAGNGDKGVAIFNTDTRFNVVQNNVFGLTPDGSVRLTNWGHGIDINFNASDNVVGGWNAREGNVIAGSELSGVEISHDVPAARRPTT